MRIFIDDERDPVDENMIIIRSFDEMVTKLYQIVSVGEVIDFISFDHDLGDSLTGYDIAKMIVKHEIELDKVILAEDFEFYVHSQNPVGKENIEEYLNAYLKYREFQSQ